MSIPEETDNYLHSVQSRPTLAERFPTLYVPVTARYGAEDTQHLQFSLKELFLVTTAAAVMVTLLQNLGIFGAFFAFLLAFLFTVVALPRLMPKAVARQCKIFDFVWGVVMPAVCVVFLTRAMLEDNVKEFRFGGPLVALHAGALLVVLVGGKAVQRISPFLTGILAGGLTFWLMLLVVLALPAIIYTFYYGVGLLGFAPAFASIAFQRRMRLMNEIGRDIPGRFPMLILGILVSVLVPLGVGTVLTLVAHVSAGL